MKQHYYCGYKKGNNRLELFKATGTPTEEAYPQYFATIGPFDTKRGAVFMRDYGMGNPHLQTVSDAERIAKSYAKKGV